MIGIADKVDMTDAQRRTQLRMAQYAFEFSLYTTMERDVKRTLDKILNATVRTLKLQGKENPRVMAIEAIENNLPTFSKELQERVGKEVMNWHPMGELR